MKRPLKYRNKPTMVEGIRFASKAEAKRYGELKLLERAGEIESLELQPSFPIEVNGIPICIYVGDFSYWEYEAPLHRIVEDTKGYATAEFKLKAKLFEACYPGHELRVIRA